MPETTDLVPIAIEGAPMPLVTPEQAKESMTRYLALCESVLGPEDYQTFQQWDPTQKRKVDKRFKKKSAVKKLQTFFGLDVEIRSAERDDLGEGNFAFRVIAKATYKGGRVVEATGACSTLEERFDIQPYQNENEVDFERRRRKALARSYHDVLSTAETRATNRAVMNAIGVGGGEVTADEIRRPEKVRQTREEAVDAEYRETKTAAQASPPRAATPNHEAMTLATVREAFRASGRSDAEWSAFLASQGIKPKQTVNGEQVKALIEAWHKMKSDYLEEAAAQANLPLA